MSYKELAEVLSSPAAWAVVFVGLLVWVMRSNKVREAVLMQFVLDISPTLKGICDSQTIVIAGQEKAASAADKLADSMANLNRSVALLLDRAGMSGRDGRDGRDGRNDKEKG